MAASDQDRAEWEKSMAAVEKLWDSVVKSLGDLKYYSKGSIGIIGALDHYDAVMKIPERGGPEDVRLGRTLLYLGRLVVGSVPACEALLTRALAILEKHLAPEDPDVTTCVLEIEKVCSYHYYNLALAEQVQKRLLTIYERTLGLPHEEVAALVLRMGVVLCDQKKDSEAERVYTRWLEAAEKALGPDHQCVMSVVNALAHLYEKQERHMRAEPLFKRLLTTEERLHGPKSKGVAPILYDLARLCIEQRRYKEAEVLLRRSIEIDECPAALSNLAFVLRETGRPDDAAKFAALSDEIQAKYD